VRRRPTLRSRLALTALVGTGAWIAVILVIFNVLLAHRLDAQALTIARDRAVAAASTVDVVGQTVVERDSTIKGALDAGVWIFNGHTRLEGPRASKEVQAAVLGLVGVGQRSEQPTIQPHVQLVALPLMSGSTQVGTIVTSVSMQPYERSERLALIGSIAAALAILVAVYVGARLVVARALRPVARMTQQAADWSADDVDQRFRAVAQHQELAELASNLDRMLDRISATLRYEKRLSAELSHELRTPLTHIIAEVELLAGASEDPELTQAHARITRSAERMHGILMTLLEAARAESHVSPGRCDVGEAVRACIDDWPADGPAVAVTDPGGVVAGASAGVVERIIDPLLDNARRYARSRVDVQLTMRAGGPCVVVADDGPGVPDEWTERVFDAGFTSDHEHGGAGLGLALARRLARATGGDIACESNSSGAHFVVSLPAG
jgi:signal transduction histidine kinase